MFSPEVNFILNADAYKNDHHRMLKCGLAGIEANIIPRRPSRLTDTIIVFGMQYYLRRFLDITLTQDVIYKAQQEIEAQGLSFDKEKWNRAIEKSRGKIPIWIKAIPEGTLVPIGCPIACVGTECPEAAFIVLYIETQLLRGLWYPCTVATIAYAVRVLLAETMLRHAGHDRVDYHLHNFGDRADCSHESAVLAGMAHAIFFTGSDCLQANASIRQWYDTDTYVTRSVIASEHSVTSSQSDNLFCDDFEMAEHMVSLWEEVSREKLSRCGHGAVVSIVIDTFDPDRFIREYICTRLKQRIMSIGALGGRLVLRPDSGDPVVTCIRVLEDLMDSFGYRVNIKGYRVLPDFIGVIQGDGVTFENIKDIILQLDSRRISIENLFFGMGRYLVTPEKGRDTYSFAMKVVAMKGANGQWQDLHKKPSNDHSKASLKGRMTTWRHSVNGQIKVASVHYGYQNPEWYDMMQPVYSYGELCNPVNFDCIKKRADQTVKEVLALEYDHKDGNSFGSFCGRTEASISAHIPSI